MKKGLILLSVMVAMVFVFPRRAGAVLVLSDGALIKGTSRPEVYFMENGLKRWILSGAVFNKLGFEWRKIIVVPDEEIGNHPTGKPIDEKIKYPDGLLARGDAARGGDGIKVYLIKKGKAQWVASPRDFENLGLEWRLVNDVAPETLKTILKSKGDALTRDTPITRPLTILQSAPESVIEDASATFRFSGIAGRLDGAKLTFETFLEGVDPNWSTTSAQERTVKLPAKSGRYAFFVRAKDAAGNVDRLPKSFSFEVKFSPYYSQVTLSGSGLTSKNPDDERLTLTSKSAEPIALRGWTLGSEKYHISFVLPDTAFEIPTHPYYQYEKDLFVNSKRKIIVFSGSSPMGVNFRLNRCVGYLDDYHKFDPPLPNLCVRPPAEETKDLDAYCKKVIDKSVSSCAEPNLNDVLISDECRDYLKNHLSYSKCVENNNALYDFLLDEWRVYLRRSTGIWPNGKDAILLRDQDGLLVARLRY